jgi:Fe-S-cluster containining protein
MPSPTARADARKAVADLRALHARVDAAVADLAARHGERIRCRLGCTGCCRDGLTVFALEAERIRIGHAALLEDEPPHAPGACAFLDARGGCRVYADRPYVCRTQGLPLRWHEPAEAGPAEAPPAVVERRDICPENESGPDVTTLAPADCWTLGPVEAALAALARRFDGAGRRVALRDLFARR